MAYTVGDAAFLRDLTTLQGPYLDEEARQLAVQRSRNYYSGDQYVKLTDRLRDFLQDVPGAADSEALRLNIVRTVVMAVVERLGVRGFTSPIPDVAATAGMIWDNSMGVTEDDLFIHTIRDGEAFLIMEWDATRKMPRLIPHPRYIDAAVESDGTRIMKSADAFGWQQITPTGLGYGCIAHYRSESDPKPEYIVKRWSEEYTDNRGRPAIRQRLTRYYDDRVEKYVYVNGALEPITDGNEESWPIALIMPDGTPMGNPAVHVKNIGMQCEAAESIPLQNAINKALIDALAASDLTAFRIFFASGWVATSDGLAPTSSNSLSIEPGQVFGSSNADARLQAIDGADINKMLDVVSRLIQYAAMVTDTPVSRFNVTGAIASSDTIKAQEGPLVNKVRKRQGIIGAVLNQAMVTANRMLYLYSVDTLSDDLLETPVYTEWMNAESADETEELTRAALKIEKLGMPRVQVWRELGYTSDEIDQMLIDLREQSGQ